MLGEESVPGGVQIGTAYGAIEGGLSICQGYSRGFEYLCKKADLWCETVSGLSRNVSHAWNLVQLESLQVTSGKGVTPVAAMRLKVANEMFEAAATGNGPVDASINALKKIISRTMTIKEFTIQNITKGSDDLGKVHMQVEHDGHIYYGFGANTDIVTASVEAYIDCINKFTR